MGLFEKDMYICYSVEKKKFYLKEQREGAPTLKQSLVDLIEGLTTLSYVN
jgi:hypothetical protein